MTIIEGPGEAPEHFSPDDETWMDLALEEGTRGTPSPNPHVGAVIVSRGGVLGTGHHARAGEAHAELNAISQAGEGARGATLYVTLEPCFHHGRGPPCAQAIVEAGLARVVSALEDPDARVAGMGHRLLREAGLDVSVGIGARAARRDHRGHILRVVAGRPMVTLKLARTADGFAAAAGRAPRLLITGEAANLRVQVMRAMHDAIMVGVDTAIADDPLLTVRLPGAVGDPRPLRVVLDSRLRLPPGSRLAATAGQTPTLAIATAAAPAARAEALEALGVEIERVDADAQGRVGLAGALRALARRGVTRVLAEGGPALGAALIAEGLADEVVLLTAHAPLGLAGLAALDAAALAALDDPARYAEIERCQFGADEMRRLERLD